MMYTLRGAMRIYAHEEIAPEKDKNYIHFSRSMKFIIIIIIIVSGIFLFIFCFIFESMFSQHPFPI